MSLDKARSCNENIAHDPIQWPLFALLCLSSEQVPPYASEQLRLWSVEQGVKSFRTPTILLNFQFLL